MKHHLKVLTVLLISTACGDDSDPIEPSAVSNSVVVTRADESVVAIAPAVWAWCGPWEEGEIAQPTLHILAGSQNARWEVRVVLWDMTIGKRLNFPNNFIFDDPRRADMFVYDPPNEASTQSDDSSGYVVVNSLDCDANGRVSVTIDAVAGSELGDLTPIGVRGTLVTPLTGPPIM